MAGTYEVVPYLVMVRASGDRSDVLPWGDFDNKGTSVLDFVALAGLAHQGEARVEKPLDITSLRLVGVHRGPRVTVLTASSGQRGVRHTWERQVNGERKTDTIHEADWMHTEFRHVFYSPGDNSKVGFLLAERAMGRGAVTKLRNLLRASLRSAYPDLDIDITPAMSSEAMERWAKKSRIKSLVVEHVSRNTGESTPTLAGLPFGAGIEFKAPRRHFWNLKSFGGLNASSKDILQHVVPQMPGVKPDEVDGVIDDMLNEGWRVSLNLSHDNRQRKMSVDTKSGVTLTFPAALTKKGDEVVEDRAPTLEEFERACAAALTEMKDDDFEVGDVKGCSWDPDWWETEGKDPRWKKAVWGAPESESAQGSG